MRRKSRRNRKGIEMTVLSVKNLCKKYEGFALKNVSFDLREGEITGFIGRNGAGKTTTLKSLLNFVHPDGGEIRFFGREFAPHELEIKQKLGFVSGGIDYYPMKKLKTITDVTRRFYHEWDDAAYRRSMELFGLDERKTPKQLSEGMKVKYSLALALSHHAKLLLFDEPTSGLDPVSRDELLDIFMDLVQNEDITLLFSTHITTDLEKCADNIIYIKNGEILAEEGLDAFLAEYKVARFSGGVPHDPRLVGVKRERTGHTALVRADDIAALDAEITDADLEEIMVHMEKE